MCKGASTKSPDLKNYTPPPPPVLKFLDPPRNRYERERELDNNCSYPTNPATLLLITSKWVIPLLYLIGAFVAVAGTGMGLSNSMEEAWWIGPMSQGPMACYRDRRHWPSIQQYSSERNVPQNQILHRKRQGGGLKDKPKSEGFDSQIWFIYHKSINKNPNFSRVSHFSLAIEMPSIHVALS